MNACVNLRNVDLNLLVSLDALLTEGNVTAAARRLGRTQPAVSAQLNRLRAIFGDRLLVPQRRGMAATPRALELAAPLWTLLGGIESFVSERRAFDPATSTLTVRIATSDAVHAMVGVPLVARLQTRAPSLRVALTRLDGRGIEGAFEGGTLDLALLRPESMAPHWHTRRLMEETFVCVLRQGHPAADRLDLDTFCALDHLMVSPDGGGFTGAVDAALAAVGRRRRVTVSVQDFLAAPRIVERTDLVATLHRRLACGFGPGLVLLTPPLPVPGFAIDMAWHPRTQTDPAQAWLRAQVADVAAAL